MFETILKYFYFDDQFYIESRKIPHLYCHMY